MTRPLTGCEPCRFWTHCGCLNRIMGWPTIGYACMEYEREPGVEG